ncbi:hypothetical protein Q8F55_004820 [Vanrija albida]|uniref:Phenazine biosynthesis protein n=1 Tax=Vanrija albida TaxID=181172 RepID=A0ABR3PZW7_9TREE
MASLPYHLVNAFTGASPHSGNQAAVVLFPDEADARINATFFLATARDFGFSETAFLVPLGDGSDAEPSYRIRFWTPAVEVPLCGHATLASAYTVLYAVHPAASAVRFDTHVRPVRCVRGEEGTVVLDMPGHVAAEPEPEAADKLRARLFAAAPALRPADVLRLARVTGFGDGDRVVFELSADVDLEKLAIDPAHFNARDTAQVAVTQLAGAGATLRINSRVFCPFWGIPEDPVTGAAHTVLGPYYLTGVGSEGARAVFQGDLGSASIDARQVSPRGGAMRVSLAEGGRVLLTGTAARWADGALHAVE